MTIGSVYGAYSSRYIPPLNRAGELSARSPTSPAPQPKVGPAATQDVSAATGSPPARAAGLLAGDLADIFYNSDGDSAEVSRNAMGLLGDLLKGGGVLGAPDGSVPSVTNKTAGLDGLKPPGECKACKSRRYVDQSDDPSVSFQTPSKINSSMSAAAVSSHEQEHVRNERGNAMREGREITHQSVTLTYDTCPECGKSYVSGGTTRITSIGKPDGAQANDGQSDDSAAA